MSKVYFTKTDSNDFSYLSKVARNLVERLVSDTGFIFDSHVPLKVHFGEKGNKTFIPATAFDGIIDFLQEKGVKTSYIETNVLYGGERMQKDSHIALAKKHGFTRLPVIIADGDIGENYYEQEINKKFFKSCKLGAEFQNYQQMIICSHFKGHIIAGFGGSLKQLAMGCASRGGKLAQHAKMCPSVNKNKCNGCSECIEKCGVKAISIKDRTALIHKELCIGCAGCIAVCQKGAIDHDWGADNFLEKVSEYAYAASIDKKNIYINFISNITKDCDCMGNAMKFIAENVGVMVSLDPVAIDTAALDMLQENSKSDLFDMGRKTLEYCEELGMGSRVYELKM